MKELVLSGVQIRALPGTQHSKDLGFSFQNAAQCNFYPLCSWLKIPIPTSENLIGFPGLSALATEWVLFDWQLH